MPSLCPKELLPTPETFLRETQDLETDRRESSPYDTVMVVKLAPVPRCPTSESTPNFTLSLTLMGQYGPGSPGNHGTPGSYGNRESASYIF
jgi:hypothetical protein